MSKRRLADFMLDAASTLGGAKSGAGGAARPLSVATDDQRSPGGGGVGALPSREVLRHMGLTDSIDALTHNLQSWSLDGRSIRHHFGFGGADQTYVRQVQQKLMRQMGRLGPRGDDAHAAPGGTADVVAAASALSPAALTARAASRAAAAAAAAAAASAGAPAAGGASAMAIDGPGGAAAPSPSSSPRSGAYVPSPLGAGAVPALLTIPSAHHHHHHQHYHPHGGAFGLPDFSVPYRARSSLVPHHAAAAGVVPLGAPPGAGPTQLPPGVLATAGGGGPGSPPRPRRQLIDFSPVYATGAPGAGAASAAAAALSNCLPVGDAHMGGVGDSSSGGDGGFAAAGGSAAAAAECVPRLPCPAVAASPGVPSSSSTLMALAVEAPCVPSASPRPALQALQQRSPQRLRVE